MKLRLESPNVLRVRMSAQEFAQLEKRQSIQESFRFFGNFAFNIRLQVDASIAPLRGVQTQSIRSSGEESGKIFEHLVLLNSEAVASLKHASKKGLETIIQEESGEWLLGIEVDLKN